MSLLTSFMSPLVFDALPSPHTCQSVRAGADRFEFTIILDCCASIQFNWLGLTRKMMTNAGLDHGIASDHFAVFLFRDYRPGPRGLGS